MRRTRLFLVAFFLLCLGLAAQAPLNLKVHVVLIDKDLNQKPVPKFPLTLRRLGESAPAEPFQLKTNLEGIATVQVPPGRYQLSSPQPIEFQGKKFSWELHLTLAQLQETVELSNDNASVSALAPAAGGGELTALFQRLRYSVVRVRAEGREGSGFLVDPAGLVLTNQHIVDRSEQFAVQFDEKRKVPAHLVHGDPEKDIAVLWANLSAFPEAVIAPLAEAKAGEAPVREGEAVFTIGNPLAMEKVLTEGVVSHVEPDRIVSDVSISPGNSGGPLFNSGGRVVGITTARQAGIAHVIRIEQALPLLEQARSKMTGLAPPEARLLPVEPADYFPAEPLKAVLRTENFYKDYYFVEVGQFRVGLLPPVVDFYLDYEQKMETARRLAKRAKQDPAKVALPQEALVDAQRRKAILLIWVRVKISSWRGRFKADFLKLRLLCGGKEVEPIDRGRGELTLRDWGGGVLDTSYQGFYTYGFDAITPSCGQVALEVYTEREPQKPHVLVIDPGLVSSIWGGFEPYRKVLEAQQAAQKPEP